MLQLIEQLSTFLLRHPSWMPLKGPRQIIAFLLCLRTVLNIWKTCLSTLQSEGYRVPVPAIHIQLCKLVPHPPSRNTRGGGQLESRSIWCYHPCLQGRAGSDSGPCCGKKQALIPNHTLSTTVLPIFHTCKILSLTQGQQEPWSSPSSRPVLVTPYKQSAAQIPPQPLQPTPQSIVCPMSSGPWTQGLWSTWS